MESMGSGIRFVLLAGAMSTRRAARRCHVSDACVFISRPSVRRRSLKRGNIPRSETSNVWGLENTCTAKRICRSIRLGITDFFFLARIQK